MEYRQGKLGRAFTVRFDDGDDFLTGLKELAIQENIRSGWFHLLGGLREADVVTGPKEPVMPPEPIWKELRTTHEVLGFGSIFWDETEPRIHLHTALGLHGETLTCCLRKNSKVYLVLEAYLVEVTGIDATRPWFPEGGFNRLTFSA